MDAAVAEVPTAEEEPVLADLPKGEVSPLVQIDEDEGEIESSDAIVWPHAATRWSASRHL